MSVDTSVTVNQEEHYFRKGNSEMLFNLSVCGGLLLGYTLTPTFRNRTCDSYVIVLRDYFKYCG